MCIAGVVGPTLYDLNSVEVAADWISECKHHERRCAIFIPGRHAVDRLRENARFLKEGLRDLGFDTGTSSTPITPVIIGSGEKAARFSDELFARGVFAQGIFFPMVAEEKSRVRTIVMATHTREDLQEALHAFEEVGRLLGVIP